MPGVGAESNRCRRFGFDVANVIGTLLVGVKRWTLGGRIILGVGTSSLMGGFGATNSLFEPSSGRPKKEASMLDVCSAGDSSTSGIVLRSISATAVTA